jgi:hypothetical protein
VRRPSGDGTGDGWETDRVVDGWRIEERVATPAALHASWPSVARDPSTRAVARCLPTGTAVVLGSTQRPDVVADGAAGAKVVRRRSGGGAVLVTPDDPVWMDVWVPAGDPLWTADVTRAFAWLGGTWGSALERLGLTGVAVQGSAPGACTRWSTLVCFGGVGAGEVTVGGRKVVGLAQRRTRDGAWFHGACVVRWDPTVLLGALALDGDEREAATVGLAGAVTGVADAAAAQGDVGAPTADAVAGAFLDALDQV